MSEELVIRCCAPTLAAIKTGSLFNCAFASWQEMTESLRALNLCLLQKGVTALPLRYRDGRTLIYLCRIEMLKADMSDPQAEAILRESDVEIVSNAAWHAPSGTLSAMFQAGALIELSGDVETAFEIYYDTYDIHELPPLHEGQ